VLGAPLPPIARFPRPTCSIRRLKLNYKPDMENHTAGSSHSAANEKNSRINPKKAVRSRNDAYKGDAPSALNPALSRRNRALSAPARIYLGAFRYLAAPKEAITRLRPLDCEIGSNYPSPRR
jgi:hypothetical protein